ncbi:hypothetical protein ACEQ8H_007552 [Pleosporales sp. CAS-2024a]
MGMPKTVPKTTLLSLPIELRLEIATYALQQAKNVGIKKPGATYSIDGAYDAGKNLSLLLVCRQFYRDFGDIAYQMTRFLFLGSKLRSISHATDTKLRHLRKVVIDSQWHHIENWDAYPFNRDCIVLEELCILAINPRDDLVAPVRDLLSRLRHVKKLRIFPASAKASTSMYKDDHYYRYDAPFAPVTSITSWEPCMNPLDASFDFVASKAPPIMAEEEYMVMMKPKIDHIMAWMLKWCGGLMSASWPPPPSVEDHLEPYVVPDDDDMPDLEDALDPQVEAGYTSVMTNTSPTQSVQGNETATNIAGIFGPGEWLLLSTFPQLASSQPNFSSMPPNEFPLPAIDVDVGVTPNPLPPLAVPPEVFMSFLDEITEGVSDDEEEVSQLDEPSLEQAAPSYPIDMLAGMMTNVTELSVTSPGMTSSPSEVMPADDDSDASPAAAQVAIPAMQEEVPPLMDMLAGTAVTSGNGEGSVPSSILHVSPPGFPMNFNYSITLWDDTSYVVHQGTFAIDAPMQFLAAMAHVGNASLAMDEVFMPWDLSALIWPSETPVVQDSSVEVLGAIILEAGNTTEDDGPPFMQFHLHSVPPGLLSILLPPPLNLALPPMVRHVTRRRPRFHAVDFVNGLEHVDIAEIAAEDMRCPHCWLPFGTTDEDDPAFEWYPESDMPQELSARQTEFRELPFCTARADNDPVRTPCGHLFGRSCLIESMEKVSTLCPTCRKELRPSPKDLHRTG